MPVVTRCVCLGRERSGQSEGHTAVLPDVPEGMSTNGAK